VPTCILEIAFPFGVLTILTRNSDVSPFFVKSCCAAKLEKGDDSFSISRTMVRGVLADNNAVTHLDSASREAVFSPSQVGATWDRKCLGVCVKFGASAGSNGRLPLCSFMRREGGERKGKRFGCRKIVGLPVSSLWVGSELYLTIGEYLGLGFGGDCRHASDFLLGVNAPCVDYGLYVSAFERAIPCSGATANAVCIAYLSSLESVDDHTAAVYRGPWSRLLVWVLSDLKVIYHYDPLSRRHYISEDALDNVMDHPHFVLVECVESASNSVINAEVINTIEVNGEILFINNDLAGYMRGRMNCAAELLRI